MIAPSFMQAAREAGLVHRSGPIGLIADEYVEPLSGRRQCLVEHWWDDRDAAAGSAADLVSAIDAGWPSCDEAIVRTSDPIPGLDPHMTYLSCTDPGDDAPGVTIAGGKKELAAVEEMLAVAFRAACAGRGWPAAAEAVREATQTVLAHPGRVSLVVPGSGGIGGHATLIVDAHDDPSGQEYVELLDLLVRVDDPADAGRARHVLVESAKRTAFDLGRPLLGHVVHEVDRPGHSARIVRSLRESGWQPAFEYDLHPIAAGGGRP